MCVSVYLTFDMSVSWVSVHLWWFVHSVKCVSSDSSSCSNSWSCLTSSYTHTNRQMQTLASKNAAINPITHTHLLHVPYLYLSQLHLHGLLELMKPTNQHPTLWLDEGGRHGLHLSNQLFWSLERSVGVRVERLCVLQQVLDIRLRVMVNPVE